MTSLKGLVENECGTQNPLLKLTSHFKTDRTLINQDGIKNLRIQDKELGAQEFVNEYLNESTLLNNRYKMAPNTFQMDNLFNELINIDARQQQSSLLSSNSNCNRNSIDDWINEYQLTNKNKKPINNKQTQNKLQNELQWSTEYLTESTIYDDAWENVLNINHDNKSANLNNKTSSEILLNEEIKKTANELLDSMQDSRFSETEFLDFVKELAKNQDKNKPNNEDNENEQLWSESLKQVKNGSINAINNNDNNDNNNVDEWVHEFESGTLKSNNDNQFWDNLNKEWTSSAKLDEDHPWLDDFEKLFDTYKDYEFDKKNELADHPNPFEEGLLRLKSHDIVNAVLLFEAAVQKDPNNMLAWQYLGTTQVENEQDAQAIRALKKCIELKPDNLIALSTLATSYTNESMQRLAYDCLYKWLESNPMYTHLVKNKSLPIFNQTQLTSLSIVHIKDFIDLQEIYLQAIRETMNHIDPDLQCCLGILFHLSCEYDKAADCFKTALQIRPNDHLLWNKLGATYANSDRNEEAIESYYQALKLCPGFVRARYNLGIGCMNLGAYKEAVEHMITALSQQNQTNINSNTKNNQIMSETIWSTLRLALSYLDRSDLYASCTNKDLNYLKVQFNIE